jgi:predicted LPLAT superfamily acyltransferase
MKFFARAATILALAAGAGICAFFTPRGFETDLYALVGEGDPVLKAVSEGMDTKVRVLCENADEAERCRRVADFDPPADPEKIKELVRSKGRGLLSWKTRNLLARGESARVLRGVERRDYSGTGLFPKADDPYYFLNDFLVELKRFMPKNLEGRVLLTGDVRNFKEGDVEELIRLARASDGRISLGGSPFHVHIATTSSKREINLLGTVSLAAVLFFGWMLFRRWSFLPSVAAVLAAGFIAGLAAVQLLPGRPHVLTLLFGTSLIGLGVDYCYHALNGAATRKLCAAFVTTALSFLPLMFSDVSVLNQMAVFTIAGLMMVFSLSVLFFRRGNPVPAKSDQAPAIRWMRPVQLIVLAAAGIGIVWFESGNDVSRFHKMDPLMAAGEAKIAKMCGSGAKRLLLLPLDAWQRENAALKAKIAEPDGEFLSAADLPPGMTFSVGGTDYLAMPAFDGERFPVEGELLVDPKNRLTEMFDGFAAQACRFLAVSFALMLLVLAAVFRRRFLLCALPVAATVTATAGVLGWMGVPVDFFQALSFFIVIGLGVDYVVFHLDSTAGSRERTVVRYGFLTSATGFGLLAFTSFQVTRSMGLTLAAGLAFAYLFSFPGGGRRSDRRRERAESWNEQREQSAGKFRILLMWSIYRVFGKHVAKIIFTPAAFFIYLFARPARRSLAQFREVTGIKAGTFRTILNFAWSLFDKTDACTLKKNLPSITVTGDKEWMKGGCFLLSTHIGCVEVMPSLRQAAGVGNTPRVHAFQQLGHNAVFTSMFLRYLDPGQLTLHAVEDIGVETAVEMKAAVERGEIVLMAGDRPSAGSKAVLHRDFFGRDCVWPKGVFRFAALLECPVFAVVCVATGWNSYEVRTKRLEGDVLGGYVDFLEREALANPAQWYNFYGFFGPVD